MRRLLSVLLLLSLPAWAACPAETARYTAKDPRYTAGFATKPAGGDFVSDLAFYFHGDVTHRTLWFLFDQGSAPVMRLISTEEVTRPGWQPPDPDGRAHRPAFDTIYLQAGLDLYFRPQAPHKGGDAPAYILLPEMSEKMWYGIEPREGAPIGVYRLTGCTNKKGG
jgi:hypothetical protein